MDRECNDCGEPLREKYGSASRTVYRPAGSGRLGVCEACGRLQVIAVQ